MTRKQTGNQLCVHFAMKLLAKCANRSRALLEQTATEECCCHVQQDQHIRIACLCLHAVHTHAHCKETHRLHYVIHTPPIDLAVVDAIYHSMAQALYRARYSSETSGHTKFYSTACSSLRLKTHSGLHGGS